MVYYKDIQENFVEFLYSRFLLSEGVSIDTRTLQEGDMFFALQGRHQNGHVFVKDALQRGAKYVVVEDRYTKSHSRYIGVRSVEKALEALALFHRNRYRRILIGITGSNGKTTTKTLLAHLLSSTYIVHQSPKSFNNKLGVPLTILGILPQTEVAIAELGTSSQGEIAARCALAQPTHGLITHIGASHLEGIGSIEEVWREKRALFEYLCTHKGTFFCNSSKPYLQQLTSQSWPISVLTFPASRDNYSIKYLSSYPWIRIELSNGLQSTVKLSGKHHFDNIAAAVAIALHLSVPLSTVAKRLESYTPSPLRGEWKQKGEKRVLLDSYNANPDSMYAAIDTFRQIQTSRVLILGDMLELGKYSKQAHEALADHLRTIEAQIFLCGTAIACTAQRLPQAHYFDTKEALADYLIAHPLPKKCHVLLKSSRKLALETLLDRL